MINSKGRLDIATFALGCFWSPDDYFSKLDGVIKTRVGYTGGTTLNPTYHNLGDHTETVEITFDSSKIPYETLLDHFWKQHDPTIPQVKQYRSAIFTNDKNQKMIAEKSFINQQQQTPGIILTTIETVSTFYEAEEYHQKYHQKMRKKMEC